MKLVIISCLVAVALARPDSGYGAPAVRHNSGGYSGSRLGGAAIHGAGHSGLGGGYSSGRSTHGGGYSGAQSAHGGGYSGAQSAHGGGYSGAQSAHGGGYSGAQSAHGGGYSGAQSAHGGGYSGAQSAHGRGYSGTQSARGGGYSGAQSAHGGGYSGSQSARGGGYSGAQSAHGGGYSGAQSARGGGYSGGHNQYQDTNPNYNFDYKVADEYYGATFGHAEQRDGYQTQGSYYVHLPDGRIQTVTYTADEYGYHPIVSYEGEAKFDQGSHGGYQQPQSGYQSGPAHHGGGSLGGGYQQPSSQGYH